MSLTVGDRLGHYDVTALIGEGGMGQVYQATDTKLNRQVALKILPEAFAADPDRLARFQREAQVLASLNHPNIAAIHGLEDSEGTKALVLELVEGPTLADRIAQGPIPVDEVLPIAKQIAEALEAAHEQGVIHRDLKPANIKVRDDGTVKALDFGLAKALDTTPAGDPSQSPTVTAAATQMGVIMGTAAYMSPEQARGRPVDKRADIWAFGAVVYEMITGQRLFSGRNVSETLAAIMMQDPDWSGLPASVPPELDRLVRRCLEKEPTDRLRDIGEARLALRDPSALTSPIGTYAPAGAVAQGAASEPKWKRALPWVAAVILAAVTGVVTWSVRPVPERSVLRVSINLPDGTRHVGFDGGVMAFSPDGTRLVYPARQESGERLLYQRRLDQLNAQPIPGTDGAYNPFFSPDGEWIAYFTDPGADTGLLKRVASDGGPVFTLGTATIPMGSWGHDDRIVYASRAENGQGFGLYRMSDGGGRAEPLVFPNCEQGEVDFGWPDILPNGNIIFSIRTRDLDYDGGRVALLVRFS